MEKIGPPKFCDCAVRFIFSTICFLGPVISREEHNVDLEDWLTQPSLKFILSTEVLLWDPLGTLKALSSWLSETTSHYKIHEDDDS